MENFDAIENEPEQESMVNTNQNGASKPKNGCFLGIIFLAIIVVLVLLAVIIWLVIDENKSSKTSEYEQDISYYCAEVSSSDSAGASGYFYTTIGLGWAKHKFSLDLTDFNASSCDLTEGLSYHIHSYWTDDSTDSSYETGCGSTYTGGHYDPNLACGGASQDAGGLCGQLNRTSTSYTCNSEQYSAGNYSICEVGDLSGKFGKVYPSDDDDDIFQFNLDEEIIDPLAPYPINYNSELGFSKPWTSIVWHCSSGDRLICAKFQASSSECD
uniref:Superoxide dismutase copper/zinc binding domain-containing protein n=1 Tax=Heterosigma akashiwo TaxID=2829 RepID=A0A7S4DBL7_HETAK|mmetsp:Transcript_28560/g.42419  ORF Transcript_28560/g.42419 Transcript_28560/m.42419 type:complete len:270 (+) Transcript_28560:249-1058(+)